MMNDVLIDSENLTESLVESPEYSVQVCSTCAEEYSPDEDGTVNLAEWLKVEPRCDSCGKSGCPYCLVTCMTCANEGMELTTVVYCLRCNLLKSVCKMHDWYICSKHPQEKCSACAANKNYRRYDMF